MERVMKKQMRAIKSVGRAVGSLIILVGIMLMMNISLMPRAQAQSDDANKILKAMSDYIAGQKTLSVTFDSDIEVITPELQKIQFASSGQVQLSRPDKLRTSRTGGYADVEVVFNGKRLLVDKKDNNTFAQLDFAGSVDQLIDLLRDKYGVSAPGADLLFSNVFDALNPDVIDGEHIGRGVIDGVECDHLAFRSQEVDWQIWIQRGARPIPRKYVITSKTVAAAPQYTLRIKEWRTDVPADAFAFKLPEGSKKVALEALDQIDEVPPGIETTGEKK
jgi:hypothetical protein